MRTSACVQDRAYEVIAPVVSDQLLRYDFLAAMLASDSADAVDGGDEAALAAAEAAAATAAAITQACTRQRELLQKRLSYGPETQSNWQARSASCPLHAAVRILCMLLIESCACLHECLCLAGPAAAATLQGRVRTW